MLQPEDQRSGVNHAIVPHQTLMNRPAVDAPAILQAALCITIVIALAGCSTAASTAANARGESQVEEPTCYRDAKSEYEAGGVSRDPNVALLNIGGELVSKDDAFEKCVPTGGGKNKSN